MERDHHLFPTNLTGIHVNFAEQAIEFEDRHGTVGRLRFTGETVLYEGQPLLLVPRQPADPEAATQPTTSPPPAPRRLSQNSSQHRHT